MADTKPTAVPDAIDEAIEATQEETSALSFAINVDLGGRKAQMIVPLPLQATDVFVLTDVLHQFFRQQPPVSAARSRLILPS